MSGLARVRFVFCEDSLVSAATELSRNDGQPSLPNEGAVVLVGVSVCSSRMSSRRYRLWPDATSRGGSETVAHGETEPATVTT